MGCVKIFLNYLRDRLAVLLGIPALFGVQGLLFLLFGLPVWVQLYCVLVVAVIGIALFMIPDYVTYRRRSERLEALKRMSPHLTAPVSPEGPLHQRQLLEAVENLRARVAELESQAAGRQDDLLEYYTLWVHQVKTPLAAMGLILQSRPEDSGALRQELFKIQRYVEMVLGYLRIHSMSADLRLERCAVRPVAAQAVKKFAPQFIYKKLRVELDDFDNQVVTDRKWLLFMIEQIISNAVKYTDVGSIQINMGADDVLVVRDQGAGIDPADLPRVFERGFTGRNGRQEAASTGLGLYLTKRVADKLGNGIEIESAVGKGTAVKVDLSRPEGVRD